MIRPSVAIAVAVLLALFTPARDARAAAKHVLVFRLTGEVPGQPPQTLDRLTQVVARSAGLTGAEVTLGKVSYEDAAALAGCATTEADCLKQIAEVLKVDHVVLGQITASADGTSIEVALVAFVDDVRSEKSYTIALGTVDEMVEHLAREVPSLFVGKGKGEGDGSEVTPPAPEPPKPPPPVVVPPPAPPPRDESGFQAARVQPYAWWVGGGGAVLAAASGVFYVLAQNKQNEVNGAPIGSVDDFHHLQSLEDEGARDAFIGNALLIGGGAALVTGVALVIYQGYSHPAAETNDAPGRVSLRPVLAPGAAGLAVELTWR
jgi:hypothetical protein